MLYWKANKKIPKSYSLPKDPYLLNIYGSILTVIALLIICVAMLVVRLPNFFLMAIFGFILASITMSGTQETKKEKFEALLFLFTLSVIGFIGMDFCSINLMLAVTWILIFTFFAYVSAIKQATRRAYLSPVVCFLPIILHERYPLGFDSVPTNNLQVMTNDLISIVIIFSIILVLIIFYPSRYISKCLISSFESMYIVRNLLRDFHRPQRQDDLNNLYTFVEKLQLNLKRAKNNHRTKPIKIILREHCTWLEKITIVLVYSSENKDIPQEILEKYADTVELIITDKPLSFPEINCLINDYKLTAEQQCILEQLTRCLGHLHTFHQQLTLLKKRYV